MNMKLWERITKDSLWPALRQVAINTALSGGMAAMGYYRNAWETQSSFDAEKKNPSTEADLQATSAILRTCDSLSSWIVNKLFPCSISYLGEETSYDDLLRKNLVNADVLQKIHPPERFFGNGGNTLRVIFDGIDGTCNFDRGLPLFCTAVAILVDDQVRISAVYDPIHHEVYSALLPGPYEQSEHQATASAWQIAAGRNPELGSVPKVLL